jgi:hypothetical protein
MVRPTTRSVSRVISAWASTVADFRVGGPARGGGRRLLGHERRVARDRPAREQRLDQAPLALPQVALARQQAPSERGGDLLVDPVLLRVAPARAREHALHPVGVKDAVDLKAPAGRPDDEAHHVAVLAHRALERAEPVAAQLAGRAEDPARTGMDRCRPCRRRNRRDGPDSEARLHRGEANPTRRATV